MAHAELAPGDQLRPLLRPAAAAFVRGEDRQAAVLLARARGALEPGSLAWAWAERLYGLVLIHQLREVEGTFALERADALLDAAGAPKPDLDWLEALNSEDVLGAEIDFP